MRDYFCLEGKRGCISNKNNLKILLFGGLAYG